MTKDIVDRGNVRKRVGIKNRMKQGHNGTKDSHEGKILFEAALGGQKDNPHGHPAMVEGQAL